MKLKLERKPPYRLQIVEGETVTHELPLGSLSLIHVLKEFLGFMPFCTDGDAGGIFDGTDSEWVVWHSDNEQHGKGLLHFKVNDEEDDDGHEDDDDRNDEEDEIERDERASTPNASMRKHSLEQANMEVSLVEAGLDCLKKNKIDQAISYLTQAIQVNPRNPLLFIERGRAYDLLSDEKSALDDFSHAIRLDPMFPRAYEERGRLYLQLDDEEKGVADLKEAIRLDPDNKAAKCKLAEHYVDCADEGQSENALVLYRAVLDLDPGDGDGGFGPEFFGWRGTAYLLNGQVEEAITDFVEAIRRSGDMEAVVCSPSSEEERGLLEEAMSYQDKGNAHWARQEYREAYEAYGGPGSECEGAIGFEPGLTKAIVTNMVATLSVLNGPDFGTMLENPTAHAAALHAHMQALRGQGDHKHVKAFKFWMNHNHDDRAEHQQTMERIWHGLGIS